MILLQSTRNGGLRYIRNKQKSELSGYELTGVDCNTFVLLLTNIKMNIKI